jgi:EF hand domain-containing protein
MRKQMWLAAALGVGLAATAEAQPQRQTAARFEQMDTNRDGVVSRAEWRGSAVVFEALDANGDGILTRAEAIGTDGNRREDFKSLDTNNDGTITRDEWEWNRAAFDRLDTNRDGRLSWQEFIRESAEPAQETPAYHAGYERGHQEGIQAGREDKPRGWDLDGQTELERADSGYQPGIGSRAEYQAGYRAGFRLGYREGFGRR